MNTPQYLLIGEPRICQQIAFVMQYSNYKIVSDLSEIYDTNCRIVVCKFRKQCKLKCKNSNIVYLDDLCRQLDAGYDIRKELKYSTTSNGYKNFFKKFFLSKIGSWFWNHRRACRNKHRIDRLPVVLLKPSELLLKVIYSSPTNLTCKHADKYIEKVLNIEDNGNVYTCGAGVRLPLGNVLENDLQEIYNQPRTRIIKLSSLNRSHCLCDRRTCMFPKYESQIDDSLKDLTVTTYPQELNLSFDKTCNLHCPSCRCGVGTISVAEQETTQQIVQALYKSGWLERVDKIVFSGLGEIFYSPYYLQLLKDSKYFEEIFIVTNGLLLNETNWNLIKNKAKKIKFSVSVDAVTAATYTKIHRGGNFQTLLQNLKMLSSLRQQNQISYLELSFVMQKDNYHEMVDFVKFAEKYQVDSVFFVRLYDYGTYSKKAYRKHSLLVKNKYLKPDVCQILQDPIFEKEIVNLTFSDLLKKSQQHYDKKKCVC